MDVSDQSEMHSSCVSRSNDKVITMTCAQCGSTLSSAERECPYCRKMAGKTTLAPAPLAPPIPQICCPHCGAANAFRASFCIQCGNSIIRSSASSKSSGYASRSRAIYASARTRAEADKDRHVIALIAFIYILIITAMSFLSAPLSIVFTPAIIAVVISIAVWAIQKCSFPTVKIWTILLTLLLILGIGILVNIIWICCIIWVAARMD